MDKKLQTLVLVGIVASTTRTFGAVQTPLVITRNCAHELGGLAFPASKQIAIPIIDTKQKTPIAYFSAEGDQLAVATEWGKHVFFYHFSDSTLELRGSYTLQNPAAAIKALSRREGLLIVSSASVNQVDLDFVDSQSFQNQSAVVKRQQSFPLPSESWIVRDVLFCPQTGLAACTNASLWTGQSSALGGENRFPGAPTLLLPDNTTLPLINRSPIARLWEDPAFSPNGKWLVGFERGTMESPPTFYFAVWSTEDLGFQKITPMVGDLVLRPTFSPEGSFLAAGNAHRFSIKIWDAKDNFIPLTEVVAKSFRAPMSVGDVAFSSDEKYLIASGYNQGPTGPSSTLLVWEVEALLDNNYTPLAATRFEWVRHLSVEKAKMGDLILMGLERGRFAVLPLAQLLGGEVE